MTVFFGCDVCSNSYGPERAFDGSVDTVGNELALTQPGDSVYVDYEWAQYTLDRT